jgi:hypothetical protein
MFNKEIRFQLSFNKIKISEICVSCLLALDPHRKAMQIFHDCVVSRSLCLY